MEEDSALKDRWGRDGSSLVRVSLEGRASSSRPAWGKGKLGERGRRLVVVVAEGREELKGGACGGLIGDMGTCT